MPTYEYACDSCGHQFETFQSMKDDALTVCPQCEKPALRRLIFGGTGVIFKGSGFYVTDSKKSSKSSSTVGSGKNGGVSDESAASASTSSTDTTSPDSTKTETAKSDSGKKSDGDGGKNKTKTVAASSSS